MCEGKQITAKTFEACRPKPYSDPEKKRNPDAMRQTEARP